MKGRTVITLNGRSFDAVTGEPAPHPNDPKTSQAQQPQSKPKMRAFSDIAPVNHVQKKARRVTHTPAKIMHQSPQKSQTLMRSATQKPATPVRQQKKRTLAESAATYRQSPAISKFAAHSDVDNVAPITKAIHPIPPQPPIAHPVVARAIAKQQAPQKPQPVQSAKELKEMLIKERLADVDKAEQQNEVAKERKGIFKNRSRLASILTSSLAVLLLGGYLTYINLPNISMRVAAARAGISANMPNYKPNGYDVNGPITYSPGEVAINYKAEVGNKTFSVKQKNSTWDSQAVLDNYVSKQSETYLTYQERGLTIYSFDNKAAWVNGGILYTIEGDASLTSEQVLRIATSM